MDINKIIEYGGYIFSGSLILLWIYLAINKKTHIKRSYYYEYEDKLAPKKCPKCGKRLKKRYLKEGISNIEDDLSLYTKPNTKSYKMHLQLYCPNCDYLYNSK